MAARYLRPRRPQSRTSVIYRLISDKLEFSTKPAAFVVQLSTGRPQPSRTDKIKSRAHPLIFRSIQKLRNRGSGGRGSSTPVLAGNHCQSCLFRSRGPDPPHKRPTVVIELPSAVEAMLIRFQNDG